MGTAVKIIIGIGVVGVSALTGFTLGSAGTVMRYHELDNEGRIDLKDEREPRISKFMKEVSEV